MTNKTDENFNPGGLYRIIFYNFFLGLYELHDQGNNRPLDGIQKLLVGNAFMSGWSHNMIGYEYA